MNQGGRRSRAPTNEILYINSLVCPFVRLSDPTVLHFNSPAELSCLTDGQGRVGQGRAGRQGQARPGQAKRPGKF
jgi:hypothetical protein